MVVTKAGQKPRQASHDDEREPFLRQNSSNADGLLTTESAQHVGSQPAVEAALAPALAPDQRLSAANYGTCHISRQPQAANDNDQRLLQESPKGTSESHYMGNFSQKLFWIIYGGILFQVFIATFDSTLMASSHPVITSYFNASNSASWLSTAFMLTSTSSQPLIGRMSDTFGRRHIYLVLLCMFALTTAWCAVAQTIGSFIAARAFCGLAAGGVTAMGSIITNDLIKIEYRGTYQAYINISYGLGSASGAAFGGLLCDTLGWRWTFGIQILPILVVLISATFTTPSSLGPHIAKHSNKEWYQLLLELDLAGSFFLICATALLILGVNLGGNVFSWVHPVVIASLCTSLVAFIILIRVERQATRPVMPLTMIFRSPRGNLVCSNFFAQIGINTIIFNAPLYFQAVKLDSASASGLRLAIPSTLLTLVAVGTGFSITWTRRMKAPQVAGAISMAIGAVLLSAMWHGIPSWLATVFLAPAPTGQGLMFPASTVAVLATSLQADQAVMSTTLTLWRNLGTVLGVAVSSGIVQNSLVAYLDHFVTGPDKAEIIHRVRSSVRSIAALPAGPQREVISAYEAALRWTFGSAIVFFVLVNVLIMPVKLPRLGKDSAAASDSADREL